MVAVVEVTLEGHLQMEVLIPVVVAVVQVDQMTMVVKVDLV